MANIRGTEFFFGTDPEMFLYDERKKTYVSAHGKTNGTKENPEVLGPHGAVQVDGMALEINTQPSSSCSSFRCRLSAVLQSTKTMLKARGFDDLSFVFKPTVEFSEEEWAKAPTVAKILGCSPDYNGWTGRMNPLPDDKGKPMRTGAGHIHIGWTNGVTVDTDMKKIGEAVARELDATLGVASVLWDSDKKRRKLYGKAGAFRPKPYGMEYRVLSNKWVGNPVLHPYVILMTITALTKLMEKKPINTKEVRSIINKSQVDDAKHWLKEHNLPFPPNSSGS